MASRWKSSDLVLNGCGRLQAKKSEAVPTQILRGKFQGIVVGIDPSLRGTGIAVIRCRGTQTELLFSSTLKTKGTANEALAQIAQAMENVCKQYQPKALNSGVEFVAAIEETIFVQNNKTAITLGAARGAVLAILSLHQVVCTGFAPTRIKQSITGHGRASKEQMTGMVKNLLKLPAPLPFDEADAAATALCYIYAQ